VEDSLRLKGRIGEFLNLTVKMGSEFERQFQGDTDETFLNPLGC
jgi:hypothetical protein